MQKLYFLVFIFLYKGSILFCQPTSSATNYQIGERNITLVENCYKGCKGKMLFFNVHDNEQTSRWAADSFLRCFGGKMVYIANDSGRNFSFLLNNHCYAFDPNRIYSKEGRMASLLLLSDSTSTADLELAEKKVAIFTQKILNKYIDKSPLVVALHNNSDTNFSIKTYIHSQDSIPHSGITFFNPQMDEDDFILTSNKNIFAYLQSKNINVVWENVKAIQNDGSMSVYASLNGIPYINVEAEHGHFAQQLNMLQALEAIFRKFNRKKSIHSSNRKRQKTLSSVIEKNKANKFRIITT